LYNWYTGRPLDVSANSGQTIGWAEYIACPLNVTIGWATAHPVHLVPAPLSLAEVNAKFPLILNYFRFRSSDASNQIL